AAGEHIARAGERQDAIIRIAPAVDRQQPVLVRNGRGQGEYMASEKGGDGQALQQAHGILRGTRCPGSRDRAAIRRKGCSSWRIGRRGACDLGGYGWNRRDYESVVRIVLKKLLSASKSFKIARFN